MYEEYLFYAKTPEAFIIKAISEHLKICLKIEAEFQINQDGIFLRKPTTDGHFMCEIILKRDSFQSYVYNSDDSDTFIGVDLPYLKTLTSSIKKKDSIDIGVKKDEYNEMQRIDLFIYSMGKRDVNQINFYKPLKKMEMKLDSYTHPVLIPSNEFQKMIKRMNKFTKDKITIRLQPRNSFVSFYASGNNIVESSSEFGKFNASDKYFQQDYYVLDFKKLTKMSTMSKHIKIYEPTLPNYPIKIGVNAGTLGECNIYMKDCNFIDKN